MCDHEPACPPAYATDRDAARVVSAQPAQGWSLLCNGVVVFDDTGELLPDGRIIAPRPPRHRPTRHTLSSIVARLGAGASPGILRRFVAAD